MKFKLSKYVNHGRTRWVVDLRTTGHGRHFFDEESAARGFRDAKQKEVSELGTAALNISHEDRISILAVNKLLANTGSTAVEAVQFFLRHRKGSVEMKISEAVSACLKAKEQSGKRERYIAALRYVLEDFVERFGNLHCSVISRVQIEEWLNRDAWNMESRKHRLIDIRTFFSFAIKHRWLIESPAVDIEEILVDAKPVEILSVPEVRVLMKAARDHYMPRKKERGSMVPYFTLAIFAGIRPNDILRLDGWDDIDLKNSHVNVEGKSSKTRDHRIVELQPNAVAWLKLGGDLPVANWYDRFQQVRALAGMLEDWPQDVMRHSFCSYSLPVFGAAKTAEWAGHSEDMLFKTYRRKVAPAEAKAFWEILPE